MLRASSSGRVPTTVGPSPFTGQPDLWAMARANLSNRGATQQQSQTPGGSAAPPAYGLTGTPGGTSGLFNTTQQPGSGGFNITSNPTPGLLGSTMSPFGASPGNQSSLFATGGKRGKH